ncbi:MAG: hypothetical protein K940chlam2_00777 [Chlamydiae bacterium]|nr:hypothetical protein [Chlamydiota bacterium]
MPRESFHLHFTNRARAFDIDFQEQESVSSETVLVNGKHYSLQGDTFEIAWVRSKIPSLSSSENTTLEDLQLRLQEVEATNLSVADKVDALSKAHFSPSEIDITAAREAYLLATEHPLESHVEVGILRPDGQTLNLRLGKDEAYGAHRVGSVTKTFTAFLALKLVNDGVISLGTKCGDLINEEVLGRVFTDPAAAKEMTLEQLLSHTSGLEKDDRPSGGPYGEDATVKLPTLHDRFIHQGTLDYRYKHEHQPGDGIGLYSNLGFDVAAWMMEIAYNAMKGHETPEISFSKIMRDELFTKVFELSEDAHISPGPSGDGDVIQAGCGDMVASVSDLLKVGQALQQGEEHLALNFGEGWQSRMLAPRDSAAEYGLGCEANASSIQFSGLNYEIFGDGIGGDVTAHVAFPLKKGQPGLVAMCDSNALGPEPNQKRFNGELRKLAGLPVE